MSNMRQFRPRTEHGLMTADDLLHSDPGAIMREQSDVFRIVDRIREYDPNLDIAYLDPEKASSLTDAPYVIFERCRDGKNRVLFSVWKLDDSVLDRIKMADTTVFDVQGAIELANARARKEIADKKVERFGEAKDIVKHIVASPKGTYSFPSTQGDVVTLRDDEGITKRKVVPN